MTHPAQIRDKNQSVNSTSNTTSTSSSTTVSHAAGRALSPVDKVALESAYRSCIGAEIRAPMANLIGRLYRDGMDVAVIVHAIEITGWAVRPTPWYLKAILARYEASNIRSMTDVMRDEHEFDERKDAEDDDLPW